MSFDWNNNDAAPENSGNVDTKVYTLKIRDSYQGNDQYGDYVEFDLAEVHNQFFTKLKQYLTKKEDGTYKSMIYPGYIDNQGTKRPASIMHELKERIKAKDGEVAYEQRKALAGGKINKVFFKGAEFDIEVKKIASNENTFYIPMTEKQIIKDEEYRKEHSITNIEPKKEEVINYDDLPF